MIHGERSIGKRLSKGVSACHQHRNTKMAEGRIKKLMDKGFGFISTGGAKDLFFHSKALQGVSFDDLHEGQEVTFTEGRSDKGPCAENVRPI